MYVYTVVQVAERFGDFSSYFRELTKFIAGQFWEQNRTIIFILVASLTYPEVIKNKIDKYFGCIGKK